MLKPDRNWTLEQLGEYAEKKVDQSKGFEKKAILVARKSAVALYWAGCAISVARNICKENGHGLWREWKKKYSLADSTANDAIRLYENVPDPVALKEMGITQAKKKFVYLNELPLKTEVEKAAIEYVKHQYENDGWKVQSVEKDCCGYDLECRRDGERHDVEVKGLTDGAISFLMTKREWSEVEANPDFRLCLVTKALHAPNMLCFNAKQLQDKFNRTPTQYRLEIINPELD